MNVDVGLVLLAAFWLALWVGFATTVVRGIWQAEKQLSRERELSGRGRRRVGL